MVALTKIEWSDSTFSPVEGCQKVSPACDHCYAEERNNRFSAGRNWGPGAPRRVMSDDYWKNPIKWQKKAGEFFAEHGRKQRVFPSLCDPFDNAWPEGVRDRFWDLIRNTPDLIWMLLTKRPQNIEKFKPEFWDEIKGHIGLGATCEDQERADINIPFLIQNHDAMFRFVSYEPALGPIDFTKIKVKDGYLDVLHRYMQVDVGGGHFENSPAWMAGLDWIIIGGESGRFARPPHPQWFRSVRDQCELADIPFLFKQWGEWSPWHTVGLYDGMDFSARGPSKRLHVSLAGKSSGNPHIPGDYTMYNIGKIAAGRLLDGVTHDGFPGCL